MIRNLAELNINAPVVHIEHGIGRYQGLKIIEINHVPTEFLTLEYANNDKIYVPVTCLHLINRYTGGDPEHAPINKLGSDRWAREKRKAAEKIRDIAADLLVIYAQRAAQVGYEFNLY